MRKSINKALFSLVIIGLATKESLAGVGSPEISLEVKSGNFAEAQSRRFGGVEPHIKWSSSGKVGDFDLDGGLDVTVTENTSESIPFPPCKIWGKANTKRGDLDVTARMDLDIEEPSNVDLALKCVTSSTTVQLQGATRYKKILSKVKVIHKLNGIFGRGGIFTVIPGYNLKSSKGDLTLKYSDSKTAAFTYQLDVLAGNKQKFTVYNKIDELNSISPSITNEGQISIDYIRRLEESGGLITSTYTPNNCINFKWQDGPWQANIKAPMDGYYAINSGLKVTIRRTVDLI